MKVVTPFGKGCEEAEYPLPLEKKMQAYILEHNPFLRPETFKICKRHEFCYRKRVAPMFRPTVFKSLVNPTLRVHLKMLEDGWEHYLTISGKE